MDRGPEGGVDPMPCAAGALRCDSSAGVTRSRCSDGRWESAEPCGEGLLCDTQAAVRGECKPVVEACLGREPGQPFCVGKERVVCGPDLVSRETSTCASVAHCTEAKGAACAVCTSAEARCDGDKLLVCNGSQTGFQEVETCNAGECNAQLGRCTSLVCDPGVFDCVDNALVQCNSAGTANVVVKACGDGATCDKANKRCNVCESNQLVGCDASGLQQVCAADGQSVLTRSCASLDPSKPVCTGLGQCVACEPSTKECSSDAKSLTSCSGLGVPSTTACVGTTCVVDQCTGECAPNELMCAGSASPARKVCGTDGMFTATASCTDGTLCDTASNPAGVCRAIVAGCAGKQPGEASCDGATRIVCGPDLVTKTSSKACSDAAHCQQGSGSECAVCITGEHACSGAQLRVCNGTRTGFVDKELCASAALCNKELGARTMATCQPNAWTCSGNTLRHCNGSGTDYVASDERTCGAGLCNANAQRCNVCEPNKVRCLEEGGKGRVQCAADGSGETAIAACANACLGGSCVACAPGTSTCIDAKTRNTCDASGAWTIATDCSMQGSDGQTCVGTVCTGECAKDRVQCDGQTPEVCSSSGSWVQNGNSCVTPDFVCNSGACAANPVYTLGRDSSAGGQSRSLSTQGAIYASRILTPAGGTMSLYRLGVRGQATGGAVRLAIYADVFDGTTHRPGARLAYGYDTISVAAETNLDTAIDAGALILQPSASYWVAAMVASSATPVIYRYTGASGFNEIWTASGVSPGGIPPSQFPTVNLNTNTQRNLSLFLIVQNTP
jgi:hypothetical protein